MSTELTREISLVAATVAVGLMAGLFYAFACAVMPGLRQADDHTLVTAMRRINVAILNGWFALAFGGGMVLTTLAGLLHLGGEGRPALGWIIAGFGLYVAMLVITFAINVPLNDQLESSGTPDDPGELHTVRTRFEPTWVRWNIVRAWVNTAAFVCLTVALLES